MVGWTGYDRAGHSHGQLILDELQEGWKVEKRTDERTNDGAKWIFHKRTNYGDVTDCG